jgi:hypothetical protein
MTVFDVDLWITAGQRGDEPDWEKVAYDDLYLAAYNTGRRMVGQEAISIASTTTRSGCASRLDSEHPASFRADA